MVLRGALLAIVFAVVVAPSAHAEHVLTPGAKIWVDPDSSTAQVGSEDAKRLAAIPSATWLTGGPPRGDARRVTLAASRRGEVPVIVAYNIPGRDCGQYSAGGGEARRPTARGSTRLRAGSPTAARW
jgi:endoglucanase